MVYVMRYKGSAVPDVGKIMEKLDAFNIKLLDGSALPKMAKVDISEAAAHYIPNLSDEWDLYPEKMYGVPTTKRKVKK